MHHATQIHDRTNGIPVEIDRCDACVEGPLRCEPETPFGTIQVDHIALPAAVAPRSFSRCVPVETSLSMEGSATDVVHGEPDVEERNLRSKGLQTKVSVDVDLRNPIDLVEPAQLLVAVPVEQEKVARG